MKQQYIHKNFRTSTVQVINQANEIIEEYAAQGFNLTLRQLYYQFVARDLVPNTQQWWFDPDCVIEEALIEAVTMREILDRWRHAGVLTDTPLMHCLNRQHRQ